jgi:hypothetical protein
MYNSIDWPTKNLKEVNYRWFSRQSGREARSLEQWSKTLKG